MMIFEGMSLIVLSLIYVSLETFRNDVVSRIDKIIEDQKVDFDPSDVQ